MKKLILQLKQNKGVSLVEVLVSVAVSLIVFLVASSFIATSMGFFDKQNGTINLQNELMESSNKLNDTLMEASYLEMNNLSDGGRILFTGKYNTARTKFTTGKGTARRVEWYKSSGKLYVMDTPSDSISADNKAGYLISSYVTGITITIQDECAIFQPDGSIQYEQPLILKLEVEVSDGKEKRSDSKTVTLRNTLDSMYFNGRYYQNHSGILIAN
ncbi:MAG: prepilin-type N-terminal cleavage/methylation domain-containing protein [Butyrivibrio sp.]